MVPNDLLGKRVWKRQVPRTHETISALKSLTSSRLINYTQFASAVNLTIVTVPSDFRERCPVVRRPNTVTYTDTFLRGKQVPARLSHGRLSVLADLWADEGP